MIRKSAEIRKRRIGYTVRHGTDCDGLLGVFDLGGQA